MPPENVLSVGSVSSPAPASPPSTRSGAVYGTGGSGDPGGSGSTYAQGAGSGSGAADRSNSPADTNATASGAAGNGSGAGGGSGHGGRTQAADGGSAKTATNKPGTGSSQRASGHDAHTSKSHKHPQGAAHTGTDFSLTLAQSLATPPRTGARTVLGTDKGKPTKSAAHGTDKGHKSDPVSVAMVMMNRALPAVPVSQATRADAAEKTGTARSTHSIGAADRVSQDVKQTLLEAVTLSQRGADDGHVSRDTAVNSTSSNAGALNNVAALSASQLAAGPHAPTPQSSAGAISATLSAPVGSNAWTGQLGTQLSWMVRQGVQNASLQVSPQHLGPVQVSISVHHGQASVWFGAAQADTRQALNRALPELRAMFANQGLTLTDSGVSRDAPRDSRRASVGAVAPIGEVGGPESSAGEGAVALSGVGLVDTYA